MADSLVLTGVKDVKKHTGTEMVRLNPKTGGDTFQLRRWWVEGGVSAVYISATVFNVTTAAGTVKLALDTRGEGSRVRIDHDGSFNFTFYGIGELTRAALYTDAFELIEHYVFPSISGGKVMTVTPAGGASRPGGGSTPPAPTPDTSITGVSVSGAANPTVGDSSVYVANVTGDATPYTYTWGVPVGESVANGQGSEMITVTWANAGAGGVTCAVSSDNPNFDGNDVSDTLSITVAAAASTSSSSSGSSSGSGGYGGGGY